jgi:hypothetical protein
MANPRIVATEAKQCCCQLALGHSSKSASTAGSDKSDRTFCSRRGDRAISASTSSKNLHRSANETFSGDQGLVALHCQICIVRTDDRNLNFGGTLLHVSEIIRKITERLISWAGIASSYCLE